MTAAAKLQTSTASLAVLHALSRVATVNWGAAPFFTRQGPMTENLIALVALTAMEIVLGIDNIVFIARQRDYRRRHGE